MLDKSSHLDSWWAVQYPCYSIRNLSQIPSYSTLESLKSPFKSISGETVEEFKLIDNCKIYEIYCHATGTGEKLGHDMNSNTWFYEHWFPEDACHIVIKTWLNSEMEWGWVIRYYDSYEDRQYWSVRKDERFMEEFRISNAGTKGRRFRRNLKGSKTEDYFEKFVERQDYSKKKKRWEKPGYSKSEQEVRDKDSCMIKQEIQDGDRHESKVVHKVSDAETGFIKWHTGDYFKTLSLEHGEMDRLDMQETCPTQEDRDEYTETEESVGEFKESVREVARIMLGSEGSHQVHVLQDDLETVTNILKKKIVHHEQQFISLIHNLQEHYPTNLHSISLSTLLDHEYKHDLPSLLEIYNKTLSFLGECYTELMNKASHNHIQTEHICSIPPSPSIPNPSQPNIDNQLSLIKSALVSLLDLSLRNNAEFSSKLGEPVDSLQELSSLDFSSEVSFSAVLSDISQIYQVSTELSNLLHKFQSLDKFKQSLEALSAEIRTENSKKAYIIGKVLESLGMRMNSSLRSEYRSILTEQQNFDADESEEINEIFSSISKNLALSHTETQLLEKGILQILGELQESVKNMNGVYNNLIEGITAFIPDKIVQKQLTRLVQKDSSDGLNIKQLEDKIKLSAKLIQDLKDATPKSECSQTCKASYYEEQVKELTRVKNRFEKQLDEYHNEILETNEELSASNSKLAQLEKQMFKLRADYNSILEESKYLKSKVFSLEDLNQTYTNKIQALLTANQSMTDEVKYLEDYIEEKVRKYMLKPEDLSSLHDYDELRDQYFRLHTKYTESEVELVKIRKTLNDTVEERQKLRNLMEKMRSMIMLNPKERKIDSKKILELSPRRLLEVPKARMSMGAHSTGNMNPFEMQEEDRTSGELIMELEEHYKILGMKANLLDKIDEQLDKSKVLRRTNVTMSLVERVYK